jgi:hypothetical protein
VRHTVKDWWINEIQKKGPSRKALASLVMLVSWEIWKERNARVFRNTYSTATMLLEKIKGEVALWSIAGARTISNIMPQE